MQPIESPGVYRKWSLGLKSLLQSNDELISGKREEFQEYYVLHGVQKDAKYNPFAAALVPTPKPWEDLIGDLNRYALWFLCSFENSGLRNTYDVEDES